MAQENSLTATTGANTSGTPKKLSKAQLNQMHLDLFNNISIWKPVWKELKSYINPHLGFFEENIPNFATRDDECIVNGTAIQANTVQAAGMQNGITSPSRPWFKLSISNDQLADTDEVKAWMATVEETLYNVLAQSNFYNSAHSFYFELGCFGTAAMICLEDLNDVVRFRTMTIGEYAVGLGEDGKVNRFARLLRLTVSQIVEMFGVDNCPPAIQAAYKRRNYNTFYRVKHLIFPNDSKDMSKKSTKYMPYKSIYWMDESSEGKYLRESGFTEFPVFVARWNITGYDIYGKGPGWLALPDSKMLQVIETDIATAIELGVKPAMVAPTTALRAGGINILPGGVSPYDPSSNVDNAVRPAFQVQLDIDHANQKAQKIEQSINKYFFADLFLMLEQIEHGQMTAREIMERAQEKMSMIGPVLERLQGEFLKPLITRCFNLMLRVPGMLPPPPKVIAGMPIKIEYISILAQAQRMNGITAIEQVANFALSMAQANPQVLDKIDFDATIDEYADALGIPPSMIVAEDKVQTIRQQRQQQMQAQQQMALMQQAAQTGAQATQAAKNLGGINTGENNALTALLGLPGGQQ